MTKSGKKNRIPVNAWKVQNHPKESLKNGQQSSFCKCWFLIKFRIGMDYHAQPCTIRNQPTLCCYTLLLQKCSRETGRPNLEWTFSSCLVYIKWLQRLPLSILLKQEYIWLMRQFPTTRYIWKRIYFDLSSSIRKWHHINRVKTSLVNKSTRNNVIKKKSIEPMLWTLTKL